MIPSLPPPPPELPAAFRLREQLADSARECIGIVARHDETTPLPYELVIVAEASMFVLELMDRNRWRASELLAES